MLQVKAILACFITLKGTIARVEPLLLQAAGRRLREAVWEPVEKYLQGVKVVLVSPDGALGRLPLGGLPGREAGTYLLEEWTLALIPVPQLLPELVGEIGRKELEKNLLLLGDVNYDESGKESPSPKPRKQFPRGVLRAAGGQQLQFSPLPGTRGEIATIERMYRDNFGEEGITVLEKDRATAGAFWAAAPRHRYLHVATHGFFAPPEYRSGMTGNEARQGRLGEWGPRRAADVVGWHPGVLSGLAFAGANREAQAAASESGEEPERGVLTAEEISTLNLAGVQLVVLSACESGLGQVAGGEGLLGLQRAFQCAGARSTVATLWQIPDEPTRAVMERFYDNHWNKDMGVLEALREAQLWMMRKADTRGYKRPGEPEGPGTGGKSSPYFWAGFVLSGDWR